jgi:hypothetical protein
MVMFAYINNQIWFSISDTLFSQPLEGILYGPTGNYYIYCALELKSNYAAKSIRTSNKSFIGTIVALNKIVNIWITGKNDSTSIRSPFEFAPKKSN